jgi:hypothetical protein
MRIASLADVQDAHWLSRRIGSCAVDEVSVGIDLERPERLAPESGRLSRLVRGNG